jgi:hypothetical protein
MKLEISKEIFDNYSKTKFHEICPVSAEFYQADGQRQTGMAKLILAVS